MCAHKSDWNPRAKAVLADPLSAYDDMRQRCPVAYSDYMQWTLFRHADIRQVIHDTQTFSNAASHHPTIPDNLDPPEHTAYRAAIEPFFAPAQMQTSEPVCRAITVDLLESVIGQPETELMSAVAQPFAIRCQCDFLGWPASSHAFFSDWIQRHQQAILAGDRQALADLSADFEALVTRLLEQRRQQQASPETDITAALLHQQVNGHYLSNDEIIRILRIWTVGEIGSIAAAIGIITQFLATRPAIQTQLRQHPEQLEAAADEILRIHGPLVTNKRLTTGPVQLGGRHIKANQRLTLNWIAANRDERVFDQPTEFRLDRNPQDNLLYGAGIHACPGAPMARLEMRVFLEELLARTEQVATTATPPKRAVYPASGYAMLPVQLKPAS